MDENSPAPQKKFWNGLAKILHLHNLPNTENQKWPKTSSIIIPQTTAAEKEKTIPLSPIRSSIPTPAPATISLPPKIIPSTPASSSSSEIKKSIPSPLPFSFPKREVTMLPRQEKALLSTATTNVSIPSTAEKKSIPSAIEPHAALSSTYPTPNETPIANANASIHTDYDRVLDLVKQRKSIKLDEIALTLSLNEERVAEELQVLEDNGLVEIKYPAFGEPIIYYKDNS